MKEIKLTQKAEDDLAAIGGYSCCHFGVEQADMYIGRISAVFEVLGTHQAGTPRPELGEAFFALTV